MDIRIKSYSTLSEALSDQANLRDKGVEADIQNAHDIHPTLLGEVYLVVKKDDAEKAIRILHQTDHIAKGA